MIDRFSINGDNALHHAVLWQSYAVEEVAKIAATFQQGSHEERVIEALKLLEAVENVANPYAPWRDQSSRRTETDGLGDVPDLKKEKILCDLQTQAVEIIRIATDAEGRINRIELCAIACERAGRKSPKVKSEKKEKALSNDRLRNLFLNEWLPQAAEGKARWELFRRMEREADQEREELESAIAQGLSTKVIKKLHQKITATNALSFQDGRKFWPAAGEIDRRREAVTDDEKKSEREAFRLSLEKGTANQPRIIHSEEHARAILLGNTEYTGFLEFVKFPEAKPKYIPMPPKLRGGGGTFVKPEKGADGKIKLTCDASHIEESPMPSTVNSDDESTERKIWKKR